VETAPYEYLWNFSSGQKPIIAVVNHSKLAKDAIAKMLRYTFQMLMKSLPSAGKEV
jgi:hypothetical protein